MYCGNVIFYKIYNKIYWWKLWAIADPLIGRSLYGVHENSYPQWPSAASETLIKIHAQIVYTWQWVFSILNPRADGIIAVKISSTGCEYSAVIPTGYLNSWWI